MLGNGNTGETDHRVRHQDFTRDRHLVAGGGGTPLCGLGVAEVAFSQVSMGTVNIRASAGSTSHKGQGGDREPLLERGSRGERKGLPRITMVLCDGCNTDGLGWTAWLTPRRWWEKVGGLGARRTAPPTREEHSQSGHGSGGMKAGT